jgi:hypothetical protein
LDWVAIYTPIIIAFFLLLLFFSAAMFGLREGGVVSFSSPSSAQFAAARDITLYWVVWVHADRAGGGRNDAE